MDKPEEKLTSLGFPASQMTIVGGRNEFVRHIVMMSPEDATALVSFIETLMTRANHRGHFHHTAIRNRAALGNRNVPSR